MHWDLGLSYSTVEFTALYYEVLFKKKKGVFDIEHLHLQPEEQQTFCSGYDSREEVFDQYVYERRRVWETIGVEMERGTGGWTLKSHSLSPLCLI